MIFPRIKKFIKIRKDQVAICSSTIVVSDPFSGDFQILKAEWKD
jgi:hypothetical protein